jgi:dienelactone hydrolase
MEAFGTGAFEGEMHMMTLGHFQKAFGHYHACLKEKQAWRALMLENLMQAKAHPAVHPDFAAAQGYCFGGQCVLEMGKCARNAKQA